jgi:uncharacterized protein YkwD
MRKFGWIAAVGVTFVAIVAVVSALAISWPVERAAADLTAQAPAVAPVQAPERRSPTATAEAVIAAPSRTTEQPAATDQAPAPPPATPAATTAPAASATTEPAPASEAPAAPDFIEHQVGAGDTLLSIALAHGVSMASIQLANEMGESQIVQLGQALRVPTAKRSPDETVFWTLHAVQDGETLSTIGVDYGVGVEALSAANGLADAGLIRVDQMLIIPVDQLLAARPEKPAGAGAAPAQSAAQPAGDAPAAGAPGDEAAGAQAVPTPVPLPAVEDGAAAAQAAAAPAGGDAGAFAMRLLELYNQARAEAGLAPLSWSPALQQAAQGHANDCASRGYGSHVGSDGANARTRIARAGYGGRVTGENWAFASSADRAFNMWFHQEYPDGPHRRNILSPRYTEVGFGVADAGNGGYYFIANFGAP